MSVLLTLLLLSQAPSSAGAQAPPAPAFTHAVPAPRAMPPDLTPVVPKQDGSIRAVRVPLEMLGGALSGLGAGILGAAVYCGLASCHGLDAFSGLAVGVLAAPLGISAGATVMGNLADGDGSYWASTLGALGGTGLDALLLAVDDDEGTLKGLTLVALPLVGAALGYELTSVAHRSALTEVTLTPLATPGPHGMAGLALAGRF